jgi:hypothetical protein
MEMVVEASGNYPKLEGYYLPIGCLIAGVFSSDVGD